MLIPETAIAAALADATTVEWRSGGTNGDVYFVQRPAGARAIKVMDPGLSLDRLARELAGLQAVTSQYVVTYRGHGTIDHAGTAYPYIEMDWVDGTPLSDALADVRTWTLSDRIELLAKICEGVDAIGARGVVHRDLKLLNIILRTDGRPMIVDLGWARIIDATTITESWQATGTAPFNSPEQMRLQKVDTRSDLFSVGIIAYYVVTGEYPFAPGPGQSLVDLLQKGQATVSLLSDPAMTDDLARVIERMIAAAPAQRPRRGQIAAEELRAALSSGQPPLAIFPRPVFLPFLGSRKEHLRTGFFNAVAAHGVVGHLRLNVANRIAGDLGIAVGKHVLVDPASHYSRVRRASAPRGYRTHQLPESWADVDLAYPARVTAFVAAFLDVQRNAGATVLISPYLHTTATDLSGLEASLEFAAAARPLADRPLLAGIEIDWHHLANATLRPTVLDLLTGTDVDGFYILIGEGMTGFRQLDDRDLLVGLKDLTETLRQNRQAALFGRMGTVGLGLVVAGAAGFSCGYEATNMHYPDPAPQGGGAGGPIARYYEPQVLSFLRFNESRAIRGLIDLTTGTSPLVNCPCQFCTGANLMGAGPFDEAAARRHQMLALTEDVRILGTLRVDQRRAWLSTRLQAAIRTRARLQALQVTLPGDSATPSYHVWHEVFVGSMPAT